MLDSLGAAMDESPRKEVRKMNGYIARGMGKSQEVLGASMGDLAFQSALAGIRAAAVSTL
jgi:hypothetical protein